MADMTIPTSGKYKIGSTAIPDPSGCTVSINPLHGKATGRTDDGTMHTELISTGKRRVELSYDYLPKSQMAALCALLMVQYYTLTYPDDPATTSENNTIECYGPTVTGELYSGVCYGGLWRGVKFPCIER